MAFASLRISLFSSPMRTSVSIDALLSYIRAYSRAVRWLYDAKNKDQAVDILVKYSKQDRKDSADTYDYFVSKLRAFSGDGRISSEELQAHDRRACSMG